MSSKKKKTAKKVAEAELPEIKKRSTSSLKLTKFELLHLRDLFNVCLPPDLKTTVSSALAQATGRPTVESKLWNKVSQLCELAELPLDDDAPDYVVSIVTAPQLGVFELAHDPDAGQVAATGVFDGKSPEESEGE